MKTSLSASLCAFGAVLGFAFSASAGDVTLTWDASATPATLGDAATGLLEFTYVDGKVKTLTATPVDGGSIVLTGDAISFAAAATNYMAAAGELVFSNAVTGAGNLVSALKSNDAIETYVDYSGDNITTAYKTIFTNRQLSDWMPYSTGNVGGMGWWQGDNIKTYNIRHETDGTITAQRQSYLDGAQTMVGSIKFQLKQVGDDIACRIHYAGYWYQAGGLGGDSDAAIANPETYGTFVNQGVSTPTVNRGYGICKMRLYRVGGLPTVRFAGGLEAEGRLIATGFTHVILERARTGVVKGAYGADSNGILTFRDPVYNFDPSVNVAVSAALSGFSGSGTVEFEATDTLFGDETTSDPLFTPWLPSNRWVTVAYNQSLSAMTNVMAYFDGNGMNNSYKNKLEPIQFLEKNADNSYATGQFHHKSGWTAGSPDKTQCVLVEFRQNGDDVQMRGVGVGLRNGISDYGKTKMGIDTTSGIHYTTNASTSHYGVHDITPMFLSAKPVKQVTMRRYPGIRDMKGSTATPGCKAQLIIKGTDNTVMRYAPASGNGHVMPAVDGLMRVKNGGEVIQCMTSLKSTSTMWVGDAGLLYIEEGGVYRQWSSWGVGVTQRVDIVGGEYRVRDILSVNQGQGSLNLLTFSGGVQLHSDNDGDYVCAGSTNGVVDAIWTVRGTSASSCDIPLRLWSAPGGGRMTFTVSDVADGSDFIMNGAIDADQEFANTTVYKTGPGTMQLNAAYDISGKPTLLKNGTWLLNGSSLTSAADPYTLDGGTLAVADGTSNSLGVLTVGENGGGITLGVGATLSFADSSAVEWTCINTVTVTGFAERSIRFGTTKSGLSDNQRKSLRTSDGKRLHVTSQGYLTQMNGTLLSFR